MVGPALVPVTTTTRSREPFLGRMFRRMGDDALEGLRRKLGAR